MAEQIAVFYPYVTKRNLFKHRKFTLLQNASKTGFVQPYGTHPFTKCIKNLSCQVLCR